jgi:hypothetical protein
MAHFVFGGGAAPNAAPTTVCCFGGFGGDEK